MHVEIQGQPTGGSLLILLRGSQGQNSSGLVAGAFMAEPSHSLPTSLLFFRRPVCEFLLQWASVPLTSLNQSQGGGDIHWASALMRLRLIGVLEVSLDLTDMVSQTQG